MEEEEEEGVLVFDRESPKREPFRATQMAVDGGKRMMKRNKLEKSGGRWIRRRRAEVKLRLASSRGRRSESVCV